MVICDNNDVIDDDFRSRVLTLILLGNFCDISNGIDVMPCHACGSLILMMRTEILKRQRKLSS